MNFNVWMYTENCWLRVGNLQTAFPGVLLFKLKLRNGTLQFKTKKYCNLYLQNVIEYVF